MKKIFSLLLFSLLLLSCAEIVPPSGGEKDTTPPISKKTSPENYTTNFDSKKIEIKFDEFIKLNSGGGNIIISPSLTKKAKFDLIGKKVIITFQESLLENTTYIINFGSSIKDINEGNILKDYKYIFSTGTFIDSLKIEGQVLNAFNKQVEKDIIVALYPQFEDSTLYKEPLYYTKTNKNGFYSLQNLKSNNYKIVALEDKNLNYIFDQENERIAFQNEIIILEENIKNKDLILFENIKNTKLTKSTNKEENHAILEFNKPIIDLDVTIDNYNTNDIIYSSLDNKTLHYWYVNKETEETNIYINTNNELRDTILLELKNNSTKTPFSYLINGQIINDKIKFQITFPYPISNFDKQKLTLLNNSKTIPYNEVWTNNNLNLEITTKEFFDTVFIQIKESCFTSFHKLISEKVEDTITQFSNETSNLIINLNKDENLIIELYNNENVLLKTENVSRETKVYFNNLRQGKYFIRVYKDENNDNMWNSGLFHVKQQPEKTFIYKVVELKDNWDKEIDIKIN